MLIAWGAGAFDSADTNTDTDSDEEGSDGDEPEPESEPEPEPEPEPAAAVTCTWPQVRDAATNVCVAAPDIPDGTVRTHQRCITDSDCMLGRCAGPTGDPGCYGAYHCTANPLPPGCGNNNSASGCVGRSRC